MSLPTSTSNTAIPVMDKHSLFIGTFVHSKTLNELEYMHDTCVAVSAPDGIIVAVEKGVKGGQDQVKSFMVKKLGWEEVNYSIQVMDMRASGLAKEAWFFPGFIDTHIHAPQYPNSGLFGKTTLLDWLNTYTFPAEEALGDNLRHARRVYSRVVQQTISHGTTTASYFATISVGATKELASICLEQGQRAFVGRVCMDTDLSPSSYRDRSAEESLAATVLCIQHCQKLDPEQKAVIPIITPRFAPSCSPQLLQSLGHLARSQQLPIQTHLSENPSEIALVRTMFPATKNYTDVYDKAGLLTSKAVMAHCIHLSSEEISVLAARNCGVSHCPISNSAITSGECPVRSLFRGGINKIGLGTDVSGGYSPSILATARHALLVSRHVAMKSGHGHHDDGDKLSVDEVLYLATQGGADVMGLGHLAGSFAVGKSWDVQLVRVGHVSDDGMGSTTDDGNNGHGKGGGGGGGGLVDLFGFETWDEVLQKWLFTGDDRNTRSVWVRGREVHTK